LNYLFEKKTQTTTTTRTASKEKRRYDSHGPRPRHRQPHHRRGKRPSHRHDQDRHKHTTKPHSETRADQVLPKESAPFVTLHEAEVTPLPVKNHHQAARPEAATSAPQVVTLIHEDETKVTPLHDDPIPMTQPSEHKHHHHPRHRRNKRFSKHHRHKRRASNSTGEQSRQGLEGEDIYNKKDDTVKE
jgi:hypothetical protein